MNNCELKEVSSFWTVGMLKELLKNYPDDTSVTVCGTPGLFYPNTENEIIYLETADSSGYETISDMMDAATDGEAYMDF